MQRETQLAQATAAATVLLRDSARLLLAIAAAEHHATAAATHEQRGLHTAQPGHSMRCLPKCDLVRVFGPAVLMRSKASPAAVLMRRPTLKALAV